MFLDKTNFIRKVGLNHVYNPIYSLISVEILKNGQNRPISVCYFPKGRSAQNPKAFSFSMLLHEISRINDKSAFSYITISIRPDFFTFLSGL